MRRFLVLFIFGLSLLTPIQQMSADSDFHSRMSDEWWQWATSIPTPVNPLLDVTGENCMVGQHGPVWFLAGSFGAAGPVTRNCSVPDDKLLFFPVVNFININTPNVCDQPDMSVRELRQQAADFIDGVTNVSAELDGELIKHVRRTRSRVFAVTLPENNIFDTPDVCNVPAGVYSPAVDEGFYVSLSPLKAGAHTLHFHAENPDQKFTQDVTYNLTVVHVSVRHHEEEQ
ncbi:MAG: hypothetical protein ACJ73N_16180 [Bryobacteraceae bacterium]